MQLPKHPLCDCMNCPLKDQPFALASGPEDADTLIVSRSPAMGDCTVGKPFSGASGKLLDHLLKMNGVERKDVRVTNVVLCRTDKPSKEAIKCCKPQLDAEVARTHKRTALCGSEAALAVAGKGTVSGSRGHLIPLAGGGDAVVTFNPAAALREDSFFPSLVTDFRRLLNPPQPFIPPRVDYTEDPNEARKWYSALYGKSLIAADIEATGLHHTSKPVSIALCYHPNYVYVIGRRGLWQGWNSLKQLLERTDTKWLWHNGKYDIQVLRNLGINARIDEDSMLLSYDTDERPSVHVALESLLYDEFDWPEYEPECVKKGKRCGFTNLREEEWPLLYKYNGYDTCGSFRLYQVLKERAVEDDALSPYYKLLIPGANAYARIETRGVLWDKERSQEVADTELRPQIEAANTAAEKAIGLKINLNSPKQVQEYLYEECGLNDPGINNNVEKSTDAESRKALRAQPITAATRKFLDAMDEFKHLDKIRGTYIDGVFNRVDEDGRLRCNFKLHGTETGRRSSEKPNLQNQPRGPMIRQLYYAPAGYQLISADYSQAELRTAAVLSQDPSMLAIYGEGRDFHNETAADFYGPKYTKQQRDRSKNINFGVFYGQQAAAFSQMYDIPYREAQRYINHFWEMFPRAAEWKREVENTILQEGELVSAFGRKRRFHLITNQNKDACLREGTNFVISSVAADFTLWSLIQLEAELENILLEVHDSLLFEVPDELIDAQATRIQQVMESAPVNALGGKWSEIPFNVDIQVGTDWGHVESWNPHAPLSIAV